MLGMETNYLTSSCYPTLLYENAFSEGEFPIWHSNQLAIRLCESTPFVLGSTNLMIRFASDPSIPLVEKKDKFQNQDNL
ncbi:hypothetical protein BV378_25050 [Nostoc sp. RF31YmG]|nr:hypothetical protein BV378_25050 [Nostoc sp. RF31YmG]OUL26268.1 hypothetical protein BV375_21510 [Nostoc sp. 106C]